jgi:hypothetical protein
MKKIWEKDVADAVTKILVESNDPVQDIVEFIRDTQDASGMKIVQNELKK